MSAAAKVTRQADGTTVVEPQAGGAADLETLGAWCREHGDLVRAAIYRADGAVLLRGWEVRSVAESERLLFKDLAFELMEQYPQTFIDFNLRAKQLEVAPGGLTQTKLSRNAPLVQPGVMQTPHVEFGLGPHRPRVVGFFCEVAPIVDGLTARVYFPEAVARLSPELRAVFESNGWWIPTAGVVQPSILVHPETKLETLQLYCFSRSLAPLAYEAYCQVREAERPDLPHIDGVPYTGADNYGITLVRPDGVKWALPKEQALEYYRAIFATIRLHQWQRGDVMLFDNVLYGHMRMPGNPPRKLHALFAQEIDTRGLQKPDAPLCVRRGAKQPAKSAIEATLAQLGFGGKMWVLWCTLFLPDFLFKLLGMLAWVSGGGYATVKP